MKQTGGSARASSKGMKYKERVSPMRPVQQPTGLTLARTTFRGEGQCEVLDSQSAAGRSQGTLSSPVVTLSSPEAAL